MGLLVFLVVAYFAQSYLKQSFEDQVTIEWANSLVWAAIGSQSSVRFVEPEVTADAQPDHWMVTGRIVLRQVAGESATHPYSALVARLCDATDRRECWRLEQLVIGGSEVDLTGFEADDAGTARLTAAAEPDSASGLAQADDAATETGRAVGEAAATGESGQEALQANGETGSDGATPSSDSSSEVATLSGESSPESAPTGASTGTSTEAPTGTPTAAPAEAAGAAVSEADAGVAQYASERRQMIAEIQARLLDLGYDPGPVDGLMGPQTRTAIENYQRNNNYTVNGEPSPQLLQLLERQE
ncbi:MAG: peptidoglycan-binding protein [Kiloniellales bacterium]